MVRILKISLIAIGVLTLITITVAMTVGIRGSGNVILEARDVSGFSKIAFTTLGEVVIRQGEEESLTIEGDDNLLPYFVTEVDGDTLTISTKPNTRLISVTRLRIEITVKNLERVQLDGVGQITLEDIAVDTLHVQVNGTGSIVATGTADTQIIGLNGVGSYDASELVSQNAEVSVTGMGSATINVEKSLDASVSGVGGVNYIGNPALREKIQGMGYINKAA